MTVSYRDRALAALDTLSASIEETERTLAAARQWLKDNPTDAAVRKSRQVMVQRLAVVDRQRQLVRDLEQVAVVFAGLEYGELPRPEV